MSDKTASTLAREIAARVWCDQEMGHCVMDVAAAEEIALVVDRVLAEHADRKPATDRQPGERG